MVNWNICWRTMHDLDPTVKSYKPSETLLEKSKFSFASGCQPWIDSWLGVGSSCPLPPLNARALWHQLCRYCVCCQHLCEFILHHFCCIWRTLFPWCSPSTLSVTFISPPLPHSSLSPTVMGSMKTSYLEVSVLRSLTLHILSSYSQSSVLVSICWKRKFLWW